VRLDVLSGGIPDSLVPETVISTPNQGSMGTAWVVVGFVGAPLRVFRFTLQAL
jgi:hypothetical protein